MNIAVSPSISMIIYCIHRSSKVFIYISLKQDFERIIYKIDTTKILRIWHILFETWEECFVFIYDTDIDSMDLFVNQRLETYGRKNLKRREFK